MSLTERSTAIGLRALRGLAGADALDRLGLRGPAERLLQRGTATTVRTAGTASRAFTAGTRRRRPARAAVVTDPGLFDLTPDDEQEMLQGAGRELAATVLRPAAATADEACAAPAPVLERLAELELTLLGVPAEVGGAVEERSAVTTALVAEALAHGDAGLAAAALGPASVATALALWGDADQQARYLTPFTGDAPPVAALALAEEHPLADPTRPRTTARRDGDDLLISGTKGLVLRAAEAELLVVSAAGPHGPLLVVVESGTPGVHVEPQPALGLRAAATTRLLLDDVRVPAAAVLGGGAPGVLEEAVHRGRVALAALTVGVAQATVDHVVPYVNGREAFGEPVSHRQGVAFTVADLAIETDGMRLVTWRAAARLDRAGADAGRAAQIARRVVAEQGHRIGSGGVQMLGGHGYVKEHPVERFFRDLRTLGVLEGALLV